MDNLDDAMSKIFGNSSSTNRMSKYSVDQIDAAKKRQKKYGGTLIDNLEAISNGLADPEQEAGSDSGAGKGLGSIFGKRTGMSDMNDMISRNTEDLTSLLARNTEDINATIREMNANLAKDYGVNPGVASDIGAQISRDFEVTPEMYANAGRFVNSQMGKTSGSMTGAGMVAGSMASATVNAAAANELPDNESALEKFAGLSDELKSKIYGQDEFIKKLLIAFKRPFVSERDGDDALNSIYITGPSDTGKHYALGMLIKELGSRKVLRSGEYTTMDLSLYPSAAEEQLFLQDLYSALQSKTSVVVFENFESCHVSLLIRLSDLVTDGVCRLADRYVMQKGQLVSVSTSFAGETVGSFEAKGKYLVFVSDKPLDKLADVMGAPFINALGDICATKPLDADAMKKVEEEQEAILIEKCKKTLSYDITIDNSFKKYLLEQDSKNRGLKGILDAFADTFKVLAQMKLERDDISVKEFTLKCKRGVPSIQAGEESIRFDEYLGGGYNGELESVEAELDKIVGLVEIKEYVRGLKEYYEVQKRRREEGLKAGELNKHMIFTGNPGTGKTTIARIVSKYLKAIGVLSGGQLVEVSRGDLVGRYVGHTAPLVNQVLKSALGGVLFIDEAYSLYRGEDDSFGLEAIDTLVKGIEDNRDNLIVILAGYSKEMEGFLEANSGLKSRFPNIINFPDYTGEELVSISRITAASKGYEIEEAAEKPLLDFYNEVQANNPREAGNGRLVRNKVEEAILNQSKRLVAEPKADMSVLTERDFDFSETI